MSYQRVLEANRRYAAGFTQGHLAAKPAQGLAILTCMDSRIDVESALGLALGDAHIVRNAGAIATDDALRSLVISHELLATTDVLIIGHTECGLQGIIDEELRQRLTAKTGTRVDVTFGGFGDIDSMIRAQVATASRHPWLKGVAVHGLVYDVKTGLLKAVD